jgi:mannose-6-phosphate isomerase-like protein (cupin superfamily)
MRLLILGVDGAGRSCVAEHRDALDFSDIPGLPGSAIAWLYKTSASPPVVGEKGEGVKSPDNPGPGLVTWYTVSHEPYAPGQKDSVATVLHHRNVIELIFIIEGGGDMLLGDGPHPVRGGDCIVMEGTSHGLRPGPQGCRLMVFAIGAVPAA